MATEKSQILSRLAFFDFLAFHQPAVKELINISSDNYLEELRSVEESCESAGLLGKKKKLGDYSEKVVRDYSEK